MKKAILILLATILVMSCSTHKPGCPKTPTPIAYMPDDNLRELLIEKGLVQPYKGKMKGNLFFAKRSEIMEATPEGIKATHIDCHRKGIKSLRGIELFQNLSTLICSENPISFIDMSGNPKLKYLCAIETPLVGIDVSHNPELMILELSYNHLSELDVSHNPRLGQLFCIFCPGITALDLSQCTNLHTIYIRQTNIPVLDLRRNINIRAIHAQDTPLQYLVVSPQHDLDKIQASVEEDVRLLVKDNSDELPKVEVVFEEADSTDYQIAKPIFEHEREQMVLTHKQAAAIGIDEAEMKRLEYRPAFDYNTETGKYSDDGIVRSEANMMQFYLMWSMYMGGISQEMIDRGIVWDTSYRAHAVVYFGEDGYADYFIYNFLGEEKPPIEMQQQFEDVVRNYIADTPLGFGARRKFSQCGGFHVPIPEGKRYLGEREVDMDYEGIE